MSEDFNPYRKWLGIPLKDQPPNHYRLLGVDLFESDSDAIETAAEQRMLVLRTFASGPRGKYSQQLLNEVAAAAATLLDTPKKRQYDAALRDSLSPPQRAPQPPQSSEVKIQGPPPVAPMPPPETKLQQANQSIPPKVVGPQAPSPPPHQPAPGRSLASSEMRVPILRDGEGLNANRNAPPVLANPSGSLAGPLGVGQPLLTPPVAKEESPIQSVRPIPVRIVVSILGAVVIVSLVLLTFVAIWYMLVGADRQERISGSDASANDAAIVSSVTRDVDQEDSIDTPSDADTVNPEPGEIDTGAADPSDTGDLGPRELQSSTADRLGVPVTFVNSAGMQFKLIPEGAFKMGAQQGVITKSGVEVRLSKPFFIGAFEVTQAQYEHVMSTNPSQFEGAARPVENVGWDAANAFCQKLSQLSEEAANKRMYRLPTEAEWEYASRAGASTTFHFGDDAQTLSEYAWTTYNSKKETHDVGQKKPNAWGLHDMYGNVFEWCSDWYAALPTSPTVDPQGPPSGLFRVARGGAYLTDEGYIWPVGRGSYKKPGDGPSTLIGMRLVLEVNASSNY